MAKVGRPKAQLTAQQAEFERRVNHLSVEQIAEKHGICNNTVQRRLAEFYRSNKKTRKSRRKLPPLTGDLVRLEVDNNGLTVPEIASKYGVSEFVVRERQAGRPTPASKKPLERTAEGRLTQKLDKVERQKLQAKEALEALGEDLDAPWLMSFADDKGRFTYHYNKQTDRYITWMRTHPQHRVVVPGDTHRAIAQAYSNMVGKPETINQMCREFSWPRPVMIEYLRIHGITHDQDPYTKEQILDGDLDEMAVDLVQRKRFDLHQSFEAKKWNATKKDAEKWNRVEYNFLRVIRETLKEFPGNYRPPLLAIKPPLAPYAAVAALMDVHVGKSVIKLSDGTVLYDLPKVREYMLDCTQRGLNLMILRGRPEKIYIPIGSDYFHVDNPAGMTTAGTPQDMATTPEYAVKFGCKLMVELIDLCRQVAPVELVFCRGNHDEFSSLWLQLFLQGKFEDAEDVTVHEATGARQFTAYGKTLLGFEHGGDVRWQDLPHVMASVAREDWGRTTFSVYFTGHLHHEVGRETGGIEHYQVNSLSPADRWHDRKGFILSRQAINLFRIDKEEGPCGTEIVLARPDNSYGTKIRNSAR